MQATKTWRDMLDESLEDPAFRKEWEEANAELVMLDNILAVRAEAGLTQAEVACAWERRSPPWRVWKTI